MQLIMLLRKITWKLGWKSRVLPDLTYIDSREVANQLLCQFVGGSEPCMITRFGSVELSAIINYLNVTDSHRYVKYLFGKIDEYDWNYLKIRQMCTNAGFFPCNEKSISKYAELCIRDMREIDVLGSWQKRECIINNYLPKHVKRVKLLLLEPNFFTNDASSEWTKLLRGKNVLVIHPFSKSIEKQFKKRKLLFQDPDLLPDFNLITFKAVQSLGGDTTFSSWFDALEWMKNEIDKITYDIAIIGCGAYGFNLAAHIKRCGKKAIHLGGATQLLFGIIGNRWEKEQTEYCQIINEHWCRPDNSERPKCADNVENACYW